MDTITIKLVTVVAEAVLRERLIEELNGLGVSGYTLSECTGVGSRHRRTGEVPGDNIKLETLVSTSTANRIFELLSKHYFPHYALVAYATEVQVIRGEKYADAI